jgi:hypothetical protein
VPDSVLAVNLRSCNTFRLSTGKAAEAELLTFKASGATALLDNELIRHNLVVFRAGEHAVRELQPLVGLIPEARLNLVIHLLRKAMFGPAFELIKDLEPSMPQVRQPPSRGCAACMQFVVLPICGHGPRQPILQAVLCCGQHCDSAQLAVNRGRCVCWHLAWTYDAYGDLPTSHPGRRAAATP